MREDEFESQLRYYIKFDRQRNPRDRITRVFSVPVKLKEGVPVWLSDNQKSWGGAPDELQRMRLALFLWINKAFGVDTKLHLFDPNPDYDLDLDTKSAGDLHFFQCADYVLCLEPSNDEPKEKNVLFIAKPEKETECIKIIGNAGICNLFQYEFYARLTHGHNSERTDDRIFEVFRSDWPKILLILGLESKIDDLGRLLISSIESCIDFPSPGRKWEAPDVDRIKDRWEEWKKECGNDQ